MRDLVIMPAMAQRRESLNMGESLQKKQLLWKKLQHPKE